ncbi:SLATT domain-containing protein [Paenibacillus terreus]|uniref:SLATT domain-containing protein n=1 Tax=Paenibacillus terreus TaxID=1387834 RepID=A0ABV5B9F3_9BACL
MADENLLLSRIESLLNKIYITRKARIKSEARLERFDFLTQLLINYYTLVIVGLSIWILYDTRNAQLISVVTVIASVLLFGLSIFVTSRNFKGRSLNFKNCYIKLDEIYNQGELLKGTPGGLTQKSIAELQKEYNEVIYSVENHSTIDYISVLHDMKKTSHSQYLYLLLKKFIFILVVCLIVFFPIVLVYFVTRT